MPIDIAGVTFEQCMRLDELQGKGGLFAVLGVKEGVGTILTLGAGADMVAELAKPEHAQALTGCPPEELVLVVHHTADATDEQRNATLTVIRQKMTRTAKAAPPRC